MMKSCSDVWSSLLSESSFRRMVETYGRINSNYINSNCKSIARHEKDEEAEPVGVDTGAVEEEAGLEEPDMFVKVDDRCTAT